LLRRAVQKDPTSLELWQRLASVATGAERREARRRVAVLDPLG